jgi:hypothetical protein
MTENRHGLVVEAELEAATGTIEREAAQTMVEPIRRARGASHSVLTRPTMCASSSTICARPMFRGVARLRFKFALTMAAYDLIRLPKLLGASA